MTHDQIKQLAEKRYQMPINGNSFDREDFELRKLMVQVQRKAWIEGYEQGYLAQ